MKKFLLRFRLAFRELVPLILAVAVFYQQVFVAKSIQPLGVFLIIFLLGSVPALRSDNQKRSFSPFARFVLLALGITLPEPPDSEEEEEDPKDGSAK
jgi:hypothetical protein